MRSFDRFDLVYAFKTCYHQKKQISCSRDADDSCNNGGEQKVNKKKMNQLGGLFMAGILSMSLCVPAFARGYEDLPEFHWAYWDMKQASALNILSGVGNGVMMPDKTLTWQEGLTMIARVTDADGFVEKMKTGTNWALASYQIAFEQGVILKNDFLVVNESCLADPVTRQDMAVLLARVLEKNDVEVEESTSAAADALSDFHGLPSGYQKAVACLYNAGVIRGNAEGSFDGQAIVRRCDGAVMLMRVLERIDGERYGEEQEITLRFLNAEGEEVRSAVTKKGYVGQWLGRLIPDIGDYKTRDELNYVSSACQEYTVTVTPKTEMEIAEDAFWEKLNRGQVEYNDIWEQEFALTLQGSNPAKSKLLFGAEDQYRFSSQAEAEAHMRTVKIPVWKISNGKKVASQQYLTLHEAIADDVVEIFTEIFNDPEQFPIYSVGGYSWRGDSARGEHNCGTAIDINANENYQVSDGVAMVGKFWKPGVNPYSIPTEGSVVRIFEEHGWSWGGNAWEGSSVASSGYHDYMHFSYMGG